MRKVYFHEIFFDEQTFCIIVRTYGNSTQNEIPLFLCTLPEYLAFILKLRQSAIVISFLRMIFLGGLAAGLLRLLSLTYRWERYGIDESMDPRKSEPDPRILAFWHGRQLPMPWMYPRNNRKKITRPLYVMSSGHRDGRMAAFAVRLLGVRSVAGSSTRGGKEALRLLAEKIEEGAHAIITPDGPRGPIYKAKPGVVKLAQITGSPIYPLSLAADRYWQFGSWDKMILPKPFAKIVVVMGERIDIPSDLTQEKFFQELDRCEAALNEVQQRADALALRGA